MASQRATRSKSGIVQKSRRLLEAEACTTFKTPTRRKTVFSTKNENDATKSVKTSQTKVSTTVIKPQMSIANKQRRTRARATEDFGTPSTRLHNELAPTVAKAKPVIKKSKKSQSQALKVEITKLASTRQSRRLKERPHIAGCIGLSPGTQEKDHNQMLKLVVKKTVRKSRRKGCNSTNTPDTAVLRDRLMEAMRSPTLALSEQALVVA